MMLAPLLCLLRKRFLLLLLAPALAVTTLLLLSRTYSPTLSRVHWRSDWSWVDMGASGMAPMRRYRSFDHASVDVRFVVRDERRCSREQLFLATRGSGTEPGAVILDHAGELVWRQPRFADEVHDFRVQEHRGQKFLTFWAGAPDGGGKQGSWYLMDDTYTIRHNVSAPGFEFGDMHEFELTPNGTALVTIYNPIPADLSAIGGPAQGYMLDGVFQEIDLETGAVLFQWNASDHIPLSASKKPLAGCSDDPKRAFLGCGNRPDAAFDYYHINSVQKDPRGNYLVSGRHTSSLTYINGTSGAPLWHMGGDLNQFDAVPLGTRLLFAWQHDARLQPDGTTITLLDNNAYDPRAAPRTESRGLRLRADFSTMNVTLVTAYRHPQRIMAFSQGNAQVLPPSPSDEGEGNVFVGWGSSAAFTEFAPDGEVLCDARFAPAALFSFQPLSSYRAYRGTWVGRPPWPPSVAVVGRGVYVSWNGATEVAAWRLQGRVRGGDGEFEDVLEVPKVRFETEILLQGEATRRRRYGELRVLAVDVGGTTLGTSAEVEAPSRWLVLLLGNLLVVGAAGGMVVGCVLLVAGVVQCRRGRQRGRKPSSAGYELLEMEE
ncbi:Arylsulfotransferase [Cordyceps fumosorosea ARSEF 2679]|uniref:Arylsulfotransferase n=1 Tax=Cordyceps fumosorosea (strain ARSEF 2679) TaxID=1081104 RepID=A0A167QLF0_CORFA|nr:Arylsulfotransferase [Cordyceps fumosorosea ARSEF 2679]OAA57745.1 Arylsulfotransferase [Cordyceps fumosorosea ARSEF 2679]